MKQTLRSEIVHVLDVFKRRYAGVCKDLGGLVAVSKKLSNGGTITIRYSAKRERASAIRKAMTDAD